MTVSVLQYPLPWDECTILYLWWCHTLVGSSTSIAVEMYLSLYYKLWIYLFLLGDSSKTRGRSEIPCFQGWSNFIFAGKGCTSSALLFSVDVHALWSNLICALLPTDVEKLNMLFRDHDCEIMSFVTIQVKGIVHYGCCVLCKLGIHTRHISRQWWSSPHLNKLIKVQATRAQSTIPLYIWNCFSKIIVISAHA